eukprot:CAMPEP_0176430626 /NCGR_PEP_ID=MMETSP0127-20121128/14357_1 /TAXON_ID=938130 /ORGANISM="Platyophrya macrostoma, Strain WH" /LENGTH=287 /DNA_ID=CAMNT_0017812535 /DNA_START=212 /DNA_END=1075 /DNA_ORIENTATION=-
MYFTASNCQLCTELYKEFQSVVQMYHYDDCMEYKTEGDIVHRPVFFGKMSFSESTRSEFMDLGLKSVPDILILKPHFRSLNQDQKKVYFKKYLWQVMPSDGHVTATKILDYINQKAERNVVYRESIFGLLLVIAVLSSILAAGIMLFLKFRPFFLNPVVWTLGSYVIYYVCMSGVVFNIIHDTPYSGGQDWYAKDGHSQYAFEGYLMSGAILISGLLMLFVHFVGKVSDGSRTTSLVICSICIIGAFMLMQFTGAVYQAKTGYYNPRFYPPAHYIKGSIMKDQGNTI